jgi:Putative polyhydroxyalkanoic acid system protein (PHA_gran_rgn)
MSRPLVVLIPHHLGKPEAARRRKSGLTDVQKSFSRLLAVKEEVWTDDQLRFRVSPIGQVASGTIDVQDDHVRLQLVLPWLLALLADRMQPAIRSSGASMLEKK